MQSSPSPDPCLESCRPAMSVDESSEGRRRLLELLLSPEGRGRRELRDRRERRREGMRLFRRRRRVDLEGLFALDEDEEEDEDDDVEVVVVVGIMESIISLFSLSVVEELEEEEVERDMSFHRMMSKAKNRPEGGILSCIEIGQVVRVMIRRV